jgi:hypothetical protein
MLEETSESTDQATENDQSTDNSDQSTDVIASADAGKNPVAAEKSGDEDTGDDTGIASADEQGGDDQADQNAPESYAEFTLPEGFEIDEPTLGSMTELFKSANLSQEQGQKLVDAHVGSLEANAGKQADQFKELTTSWLSAAKKDDEIGGDNFKQATDNANVALKELGTPDLIETVKHYGLGNHPEFIRFFAKVGALTREDNPTKGGEPHKQGGDRAENLYPDDPVKT